MTGNKMVFKMMRNCKNTQIKRSHGDNIRHGVVESFHFCTVPLSACHNKRQLDQDIQLIT